MKTNNYKFRKLVSFPISMAIFTLSITSYSSSEASAVNSSMAYTIFDASTGAYVSEYTLTANPVTDNSRAVIGDEDGRKGHDVLNGVVEINNGVTGFVVDSHTIATAAHCVITDDGNFTNSDCPITSIKIYGTDGTLKLNITSAYDVHIPSVYISNRINNLDCSRYDYAMITVPYDLSGYVNFNLGVPTDSIIGSSLPVYVTGYPDGLHDRMTAVGNIKYQSDYDCTRLLLHDVDATGGQSGSPLYTYSEYGGEDYYTVIGIHTGWNGRWATDDNGNYIYDANGEHVIEYTSNRAIRMTTDLIHFYKNNPNIEY